MIHGPLMMPAWHVDNLDSAGEVNIHTIFAYCQYLESKTEAQCHIISYAVDKIHMNILFDVPYVT